MEQEKALGGCRKHARIAYDQTLSFHQIWCGFWDTSDSLDFMKLSRSQVSILRALANGYQLKSHRYLDGTKASRLHGTDGEAVSTVSAKDVEQLEARGLIAGNMKFPAAVYLLTERGARLAASLAESADSPLKVRFPPDGDTRC